MEDPQPGQTVTLTGLKAAEMNGLTGTVVKYDRASGRYEVDLGPDHGLKAIRLDNLLIEEDGGPAGHSPRRDPDDQPDEFAAGELIGRLLKGGFDDRSEDGRRSFPSEDRGPSRSRSRDGDGRSPQAPRSGSGRSRSGEPPPGCWGEGRDGDRSRDGSRSPGGERPFDPEAEPPVDGEQDGRSRSAQSEGRQRVSRSRSRDQAEGDAEPIPPDFGTLSVKELKEFLAIRAVSTIGVTEKGELIELCRKSAQLPLRKGQDPARGGGAPPQQTQASGGDASRLPRSSGSPEGKPPGDFGAQRGSIPPGPWAGIPSAPDGVPPPGFGPPPPHYGGAPPAWGQQPAWAQPPPPPGFPFQQPPGAPGFPYAPPPTGFSPPEARRPRSHAKEAPRSREEAMDFAERRLATARPSQETLTVIDRFVRDFRLGEEVELGLRLVSGEKVRTMLGASEVRRRVRDAGSSRVEVLLKEIGRADPEAEMITRVLLHGGSKDKARPDRDRRERASGARRSYQRSRSRRRRREPSRRGEEPARRSRPRRHSRGRSRTPHGSRAGVWNSPPRDSKGHPAGGTNGSRRSAAARGAQELDAWVMDLDSGRGAFMKYIEPLQREFGDLTALAACVLPKPISASVVGWIDSSLWPVLGVEALGHKLTFAKGICALSQRFGMGGPGAST